ncbi:MAG: putative protein involved in cytokinesis, contains TGc (transglutaminase/protease-like) domain, partial [Myxococcaceae bacterium]|nr:putative protein involved in cytokinesis, contains TGc (transglutaminase/protease-like) domain [Myxococcaceae bacterium]
GVPMLNASPVEVADGAPPGVRGARFEMPDHAGAWIEVAPVVDGEAAPAPTAEQSAASFLVDYDQEPLRSMCTGTSRPAEEIVDAVDAHIARKSLAIGIITASSVAARREGDCTEHAVLTAALLRCHGHPARLAVGMLVGYVGGRWFAGGHMWAEHYDRGWRVADATRPERHAEVAHLRQDVVADEGPGCTRTMSAAIIRGPRLRVRVSAQAR